MLFMDRARFNTLPTITLQTRDKQVQGKFQSRGHEGQVGPGLSLEAAWSVISQRTDYSQTNWDDMMNIQSSPFLISIPDPGYRIQFVRVVFVTLCDLSFLHRKTC